MHTPQGTPPVALTAQHSGLRETTLTARTGPTVGLGLALRRLSPTARSAAASQHKKTRHTWHHPRGPVVAAQRSGPWGSGWSRCAGTPRRPHLPAQALEQHFGWGPPSPSLPLWPGEAQGGLTSGSNVPQRPQEKTASG